jgi:hypothetical protein
MPARISFTNSISAAWDRPHAARKLTVAGETGDLMGVYHEPVTVCERSGAFDNAIMRFRAAR